MHDIFFLQLPVFSCVQTESAVYLNTVYLSTLLICFSSLPSTSTVPAVTHDYSQLISPKCLQGRGETGKDKENYLLPCLFFNSL